MMTNIRGTDVSIFAILDGHGGEFAAVFAKENLIDKLTKKILAALDVQSGKVTPLPHRRNSLITPTENKDEDDDKDEKKRSPAADLARTASQRRTLKKTLSTDNDCDSPKSNCNQEQDSFLSKLSSIRITKESFMKAKDKAVRPNEYEAGYYVDRNNKIDFGKMVTDLVLLTDFELIEKAKKQVRQKKDRQKNRAIHSI